MSESLIIETLKMWIKIIFGAFSTLKWIGGLFEARRGIYPPLKQAWNLGFMCSTLLIFCSFFSVKMEFDLLPDLP